MKIDYLMENTEEHRRLIMKTDIETVIRQARWAGLSEGMKAADVGCGAGITTAALSDVTGNTGECIGIDGSPERIEYARTAYPSFDFKSMDVTKSFGELAGTFDFVWVRFLLEYFNEDAFETVRNIASLLKPGGILFLADLDGNCMNHYPLPESLEKILPAIFSTLMKKGNWDPFMGRKLYSFLYNMKFTDIEVALEAHHLFWGPLTETDEYNWRRKLEVAAQRSGVPFDLYPGG
ncbi:MAG: class I SAM-dependent methyltransferase, partial [Spirochaetia bacterium]